MELELLTDEFEAQKSFRNLDSILDYFSIYINLMDFNSFEEKLKCYCIVYTLPLRLLVKTECRVKISNSYQ